MSFFNSSIVQEEMEDIVRIQDEIYKHMFKFSSMSKEEKVEHIELLESLLKKQQILYTRLSLSDDPEAKTMKENIMKSAKSLGFSDGSDLNYIFKNMSSLIEDMKKTVNEQA